ncbi:MAG: glycosyltransferase [Candidatus Eiseniibacteriota bacterium]|jgi:sucrose synthase
MVDRDGNQSMVSETWRQVQRGDLGEFIQRLRARYCPNGDATIVLRDDIRRAFQQFVKLRPPHERRQLRDSLGQRIAQTEEVIFASPGTCIVVREEPGHRCAYLTSPENGSVTLLDQRQLLGLRESIVLGHEVPEHFTFGIDFTPFRIFPDEYGEASDIGNGPWRVAGMLDQGVRDDPRHVLGRIVDLLSDRRIGEKPLLFTRRPDDLTSLRKHLHRALALLDGRPGSEEIESMLPELELLGFTRGWGRTVSRAQTTLGMFEKLLLNPSARATLRLFERLPLIERLLLVSVHGWFAQHDVLGRPDTGGQVVYVLDQARALDAYLRGVWRDAGVPHRPRTLILTRLIPDADGTTCDQRLERVEGSKNAWILRVPFRGPHGDVLPHWISRFQVWPHLDRFVRESFHEVMRELGGKAPDLVVGNYSDGNMVASVLGREWQVPIAVIAHALEKTKYLMSDLYWRDNESNYRFSIQFLADILAANSADFIITSSYQEIAGTRNEMGQYESYELFTLPERYRVLRGVNVRSARFVINPPGVNTSLYYPANQARNGDAEIEQQIEELVFGGPETVDGTVGHLAAPGRPLIFTMARMDRIKNLTGLVQAYARRQGLRDRANLLILSGVTRYEESEDHEERQQIQRMYRLFEQHGLHDSVRWLPGRLGQQLVPHYYRFVARRRGVFVQPALFEAFGLTVLEAMASGLPVVATRFGGPASVIEDGVSGILIDPNRVTEVERAVLMVIGNGEAGDGGDGRWEAISHAALRRVHEHFSWKGHARRLLGAHGVYSAWSHIFPERRKVRRSYVDALHHFLFKRMIAETWPE